ncbi:hypothetical protein D3C74_224870 [compost metagenome]
MLIIGESHVFSLNNFYTPYRSTTLYLQYGQNEKDMINDTLETAEKHEIDVFTYTRTSKGNLTEIKVFGSPGVEEHINNDLAIYAKRYKSLFLGDIQFSFHKLESIQGLIDVHDFYLTGNSQQAELFKTDLINTYAGNFPQEGYIDNDTRDTIIAIWLLMIGVTLLLTYYDVIYQKKENLIRISMGERITTIIWRNIVSDSFLYTFVFLFIFLLLENVTSVSLDFQISIVGIILLLVLNALVYISLRSYHLREAFSNTKSSSKKLLSVNYALKIVTVMVTIFVISSNLVLVFESYSLYKQRSFFHEHADYSYITTRYRPVMGKDGNGDPKIEESERLQMEFYTRFFSKANATLIYRVHKPSSSSPPTIMTNRNAFSYLEKNIKELKQHTRSKEITFILPQLLENNEELLTDLVEEFSFFEGQDIRDNYKVVYYKDTVSLVAINVFHIYGSEILENPIIIYNNISPETQSLSYEPSRSVYLYDIMYDITDEEFNQFVQEHQLNETNAILAKTNVLQKYNESWNIAKRTLYINCVFSILVLFLEFMIITSIIKLEYEVNAVELSVKKVLGHSVWEKNRKIILMTLITTLFSIGIAITTSLLLKLNSAVYLSLGGLIILVSEMIVIFLYIRKIEKLKIQNILKGGNI